MESTKMPTAKDMDTRRRNSLMFFMRDWQESSSFEEQEASMLQVQRGRAMHIHFDSPNSRARAQDAVFFVLQPGCCVFLHRHIF